MLLLDALLCKLDSVDFTLFSWYLNWLFYHFGFTHENSFDGEVDFILFLFILDFHTMMMD